MTREPEVNIRHELKPGDLGFIIHLHGDLYIREFGFNIDFETYVAGPLIELVQRRSELERVWVVEVDGEIAGSVVVSRYNENEAQLRYLLLHPRIRGHGLGKKLVEDAMAFARNCGYESMFLWTVDACRDAGRLYTSLGFRISEEKSVRELWGQKLSEQRYERKL